MPGDDLYWNPVEADSEESIDYHSKQPYVDPWDLENYAYIREHLDSMELSSPSAPSGSSGAGSSGEFAEANSHSFYYVPGNIRPVPPAGPPYVPNMHRHYDSLLSEHENYAAIDEVKMYDRRKTRSEMFGPSRLGRFMQEYESGAVTPRSLFLHHMYEIELFEMYVKWQLINTIFNSVHCSSFSASLYMKEKHSSLPLKLGCLRSGNLY